MTQFHPARVLMHTLAAVTLTASTMPASAADTRFVLVSHAPDSDSWWNTIKNAVKQAGEDFDVSVDYRNPPSGDLADMARLLEQSAARGYHGVVTSIADFDVLKKPLAQVTGKQIPLITINSGTAGQSESLKALLHVGQPEYDAGYDSGLRAKAAGVKRFLCVNHYATNPASFERCRGFAEALGVDFRKATLDAGDDPTIIESKVSAYLRNNPGTDAVLTLGPTSAAPAIKAVKKMGLAGKLYFASFDLSDDISRAIKDGTVAVAIDQQPYLQGYIPIALLAIMKKSGYTDVSQAAADLKAHPKYQARLTEYGLTPVYKARHINSGPGFISKDNIAVVEQYAGQYR